MPTALRFALVTSLVACSSQQPNTTNADAAESGPVTMGTWTSESSGSSQPNPLGSSASALPSAASGTETSSQPTATDGVPSEPNASDGGDPAAISTGAEAADTLDASLPDPPSGSDVQTGEENTSSEEPFPEGSPSESDVAAVPTVRQEHAVVALNDEIYVLGGFTPSATATVQAYSPTTDTWRDIADFPVVFHHPNAAAIDGKLYVAGFLLGSSLSDGDGRVFAYDPDEDEWSPRTSMPAGTDRGSACVTTLDSKLYVFGGASSTTLPDVSAYDTVNDSWEELTFMPELREHCVAATVDDRIYIVSGRAGSIGGVGAESFVYDPRTDTYDQRAPIPTPRGGTAGAVLNGRIFVFGGEGNPDDDSGVFSEVEAYDPATDTWHTYPSMTMPRHGFGAATLDDRIYLPGGGSSQGFGAVDSHTVFTFEP